MADKNLNRYAALIDQIFKKRYRKGATRIEFERDDLIGSARELKIDVPKNLGDVVYALRYRKAMPKSVLVTQPKGREWIIEGAGRAKYAMVLATVSRIAPRTDLVTTGIPDATPEMIRCYALDDEQALLAIVRYNRLVDIFLGITTYSLQNHLRTTVKGIGQIEIDELYFGVDRYGCHYVIPIQAKGGTDQISAVQTRQDISWCSQKFPTLRSRAISVQFMSEERVAMIELAIVKDTVRVVEERHYKLVPKSEIDAEAIAAYRP